ncbi:MAG TPA: DUF4388 domain-containing protein [Candidatus Eisenbacteria bacterium]|jgi:hypothetical protein
MSAEALRGDLSRFSPSEVLQLLQLAQATGRLELERSTERAEIFVERGRPVFARTSGTAVRSGEMLLHRGAVSAEALDAALERQRAGSSERLGALLVASGAVAPDQVKRAVSEALRRLLYGLLLWREGRFRFLAGETMADQDIKLEADLDRLILEGLRQADEARAQRG